ncbi:MAG: GspH/FimT family pseudopilin [Gammaproteobacteria bacterium]
MQAAFFLIRRNQGVTLIELLVVVAVLSLLAVLAGPSFSDLLERKRLQGAAETLYADLQFAKAEAIRRNERVYVSFKTTAPQCYGLSAAAACDCHAASCTIDGVSKVVDMADFGETAIASAAFSTGSYTYFDPRRGTAAGFGGTVKFESPSGKRVHVRVSTLRIKICSPSGSSNIFSYSSSDCPP